VSLSQQFSSRHRTSNKMILSTEHQYKKLLCYTNTKKTQKQFFTVTEIVLNDDHVYWSQNSNNKFNLILDIFYENWCYPNCKHCIATVFWFQTITVIVPLQKFREKLSKGAITNDHSNGSTSPSRLSTNVTITEKLKNLKFSQKLRYSSDTELINNFDKKSQFRFDCKIQHFVSITNINTMNPKLTAVTALWKTSFRSCFKLGTHPQCYGFMITSCKHLIIFPFTQQKRERKLLMTIKQMET